LYKLGINGQYLEVGSGPGLLTALIARKKPEVRITALEPSAQMIDFARTHARKQGVEHQIKYVCGSVEDGKTMEGLGQFDLVYSTFSLHHWENPNTAWRYLLNRVKKNGTLFVHDLKRASWLYYLPFKNGMIGFTGMMERIRMLTLKKLYQTPIAGTIVISGKRREGRHFTTMCLK